MPPKRKRAPEPESEDEDESPSSESSNESDSENEENDGTDDDEDEDEDDDGSDIDEDDEDDDDSGDDEDDEEEEEEIKPTKKRAKTTATTKASANKKTPTKKTSAKKDSSKKTKSSKKKDSKKAKSKSSSRSAKDKSVSSEPRLAKLKATRKSERIEEARKAYKWWEAPQLAKGTNWQYLEHPGICFPPNYIPHNIPLKYDNKEVKLTPEQEEMATFYAAMPEDGPQLGNPKTRPVFQKNFFEDFKEILGPSHIIKSFEKCDFSAIRDHLLLQKNLKKVATDEEKQFQKEEKEKLTLNYGYALIDGRIEKMGNYNMEPPGLFRGRGEHPKTGKLKVRCYPESVSLNMSEDACVPIAPIPGHSWESIRHDPTVTWLCGWTENVQSQNKYVMLAASSSFKGKSDRDKYGKAIKLKTHIDKIRADYTSKIKQTKNIPDRQLGTAMWVIDKLALRVGGEKGEDEADTVGCCSLRVEHLSFNVDQNSFEIELEFLGKDSMLYKQNINFAQYGDLGKIVYSCLKSFCAGKKQDQDVFEYLTPPILNKHLDSLMKGLTAKVFRTYNASVTLEEELPKAKDIENLSVQDKLLLYNAANRQVAILCNHQRTVSKAMESMFENLNDKLSTLKSQLEELKGWRDFLNKGKEKKIPLKKDDKDQIEEIQKKITDATTRKEKAKTNEDKLAAAQALDDAKAALKDDQKRRFLEKHQFKSTPTKESIENRIDKWNKDIEKLEKDIQNRDENKEVALGTSKINYMDPRISVAWCKRCEVPIDKIFARTLRDKFNWAMAVPPDWKFE